MTFKYANSGNSVVSRVTAVGVESYLVTAPIVVAWLAEGNTPEPFEGDAERFARLKREKLTEINAGYERDMSAVKDGYPPSEILSWDKQEREARAYRADPNASTPFVDALAGQRQIAKLELVDRIMAKVESFETVVGALTGKRQRLEDQITAITEATPDWQAALAAIVW